MREVNPMETDRAKSWELYINAPMPMVTIFKTFDISNLMLLKEKGYQLNMLICYCIGAAASRMKEFHLLPVQRKMMYYDRIGISVIVANKSGGINSCDIPFDNNLISFQKNYAKLTKHVYESCEDYEVNDIMMIGTSALVHCEIDGVMNMYSGIFNNPFLIWGKYRTDKDKTTLQISFQFHHVQMDGMEACNFLTAVQGYMDKLNEQRKGPEVGTENTGSL